MFHQQILAFRVIEFTIGPNTAFAAQARQLAPPNCSNNMFPNEIGLSDTHGDINSFCGDTWLNVEQRALP